MLAFKVNVRRTLKFYNSSAEARKPFCMWFARIYFSHQDQNWKSVYFSKQRYNLHASFISFAKACSRNINS